jgi:hypothetical protein
MLLLATITILNERLGATALSTLSTALLHLAVTAVTELTDNKRIIEDVPAEAH